MLKRSKESSELSLFEQMAIELQRQINPNENKQRSPLSERKEEERVKLSTFVERTSNITLEDWQLDICEKLESLTYTLGRRILMHKPPQHGGSVIVSQRLPAYIVGDDPTNRVKVACYNIEHATGFTGINKNIMQSVEYSTMFPDKDSSIPYRCSDKQFSTRARRDQRDGQPSIMALGLLSGFVGQGADTLIIDDPYASPQDANSIAVCKSVWQFWSEGARVRIDDNTNVIIMFHRYHEDDFIGQLIREEGLLTQGGLWELYSYRAEWDGDERLEIGGPDPMHRKNGEYLSPRKAKQKNYYNEQKRNPSIWQSQFQGKPSRAEGGMFKVGKFRIIPKLDVAVTKVVRPWDIASSEDAGDWSAGPKMALGINQCIYILDVIRFREATDVRNTKIRMAAAKDRRRHIEILTLLPQDPGAAGKDMAVSFQKLMIGHNIKIVTSFNKGNKEYRADPWSQYVNSGLVFLVYDGDIYERDNDGKFVSWVPDFIDEHRRFLTQKTDDQVDACSDGFAELALEIDNPAGEDFDTLGLYIDDIPNPGSKINFIEEEERDIDLYNEYLSDQDINDESEIRIAATPRYRKAVSQLSTRAQRQAETKTWGRERYSRTDFD